VKKLVCRYLGQNGVTSLHRTAKGNMFHHHSGTKHFGVWLPTCWFTRYNPTLEGILFYSTLSIAQIQNIKHRTICN